MLRRVCRSRVFVVATWMLAVVHGTPARTLAAQNACVASHIDAQRLRAAGKLVAAQEKLLSCGAEKCPDMLRQDCAGWLVEVERDLPSVIVSARDAEGHDLVEVRVLVDGASALERLDGKPIPLDPGVHRISAEHEGSAPVEAEIVASAGEKNRIVSLVFGSPKKALASPSHTVAWALGGVGLAALGSFAFFAISGERQYRDLRSSCSPRCDTGDVHAVRTKFVVADVSLGIGIVSLGLAATMLLTTGARAEERAVLDLRPLAGGGIASFSARF
jgi:hypothetical protein